jgi:hypothetical protein
MLILGVNIVFNADELNPGFLGDGTGGTELILRGE